MKYKVGDITRSNGNPNFKYKVLGNKTDHNGYQCYEISYIENNKPLLVDINVFEITTILDVMYLRSKKLEKIINKINENINSM